MQKKLLILALAVLILVAGGVLLWEKKTGQEVPQSEVKNTDISNVDTSDWKTYRNSVHNFSFKYPKDWMAEEYSDKSGLFLMSPETIRIQKDEKNLGYPMDLTVSFFSSLKDYDCVGICSNTARNYEDIEKYLLEDPFNYFGVGQILINGKRAFEAVVGGNRAEYGVFIENSGSIYFLKFGTAENKAALSEVQKNILMTFRVNEK